MVELKAIGLVEEELTATGKSITLTKEFDWMLNENFEKLREGFEPVDNREFMDEGKGEKTEDDCKGNRITREGYRSSEVKSKRFSRVVDN